MCLLSLRGKSVSGMFVLKFTLKPPYTGLVRFSLSFTCSRIVGKDISFANKLVISNVHSIIF
jgi:hypothetical protein